jgi:hypothetical protein
MEKELHHTSAMMIQKSSCSRIMSMDEDAGDGSREEHKEEQ